MSNNSAALQALAAVVAILVFAGPVKVFVKFQPDLIVRVRHNEATIPKDLQDWLGAVADRVRPFEYNHELSNTLDESSREIFQDPVAHRLTKSNFQFHKVTFEIANNTENTISNINLRLDRVRKLWGVGIKGTFLNHEEVSTLKDGIVSAHRDDMIILPRLPALSPESVISVTLYGEVEFVQFRMTTPGHSYSIRELVEVEETWLVKFYLFRDKWVFAVGGLTIAGIVGLFVWKELWPRICWRIITRARKFVLYNLAQREAREGNPEEAMVLLTQAVKLGYSYRDRVYNYKDLAPLRDREDFKNLFDNLPRTA